MRDQFPADILNMLERLYRAQPQLFLALGYAPMNWVRGADPDQGRRILNDYLATLDAEAECLMREPLLKISAARRIDPPLDAIPAQTERLFLNADGYWQAIFHTPSASGDETLWQLRLRNSFSGQTMPVGSGGYYFNDDFQPWSSDGSLLALPTVQADSYRLLIYNLASGRLIEAEIRLPVRMLRWSPVEDTLLALDSSGTLRRLDALGRVQHTLRWMVSPRALIDWLADGDYFFTLGRKFPQQTARLCLFDYDGQMIQMMEIDPREYFPEAEAIRQQIDAEQLDPLAGGQPLRRQSVHGWHRVLFERSSSRLMLAAYCPAAAPRRKSRLNGRLVCEMREDWIEVALERPHEQATEPIAPIETQIAYLYHQSDDTAQALIYWLMDAPEVDLRGTPETQFRAYTALDRTPLRAWQRSVVGMPAELAAFQYEAEAHLSEMLRQVEGEGWQATLIQDSQPSPGWQRRFYRVQRQPLAAEVDSQVVE